MIRPTPTREAEFSEFVRSASRYLTRTAYLLSGNEEIAAELVQESLIRTYAAWWRVRPEGALGYARRVLVNLNIDRLRARRPDADEWADQLVSSGAEAGVDDRDEVARMLTCLPPQQRRVIVLRYFGELAEAEVAQILGISVGTVKSSCSRGLARLREQFDPALKGEHS